MILLAGMGLAEGEAGQEGGERVTFFSAAMFCVSVRRVGIWSAGRFFAGLALL